MSTQLVLSKLFAESVQRLNQTFTEVNSDANAQTRTGYAHLLDQGNALFISDNRQPYLIPIELTLFFHLKTGDRLQALTTFNSESNNYVVTKILTVEHIAYDNAPLIRAEHHFELWQQEINLGTSVLIPVRDNADIVDKVADVVRQLPTDIVPVLLSFDSRATNFDVPTMCITKPTYSAKEKLMACLLTFFQCKQQADIGKDVVLIIDSLDKMFVAYNNCIQSTGSLDPNLLSTAALMDFENILMCSGNLKAGGSLTILGLHRAGNSLQQLYVTDRLHQIMDQTIEFN